MEAALLKEQRFMERYDVECTRHSRDVDGLNYAEALERARELGDVQQYARRGMLQRLLAQRILTP